MRNILLILFFFVSLLAPEYMQAQVVLKTDTVEIPCTSSSTLFVPFKVENFNNVGGLQFTMTWNPAELAYQFVGGFNPLFENDFAGYDSSAATVAQGRITFIWGKLGGLSVPNNTTVFGIVFKRLSGAFSPVTFDVSASAQTPVKITDPNGSALPRQIKIGGVKPIDTVKPAVACPANKTMPAAGPVAVSGIAPTANDNCGLQGVGWTSTGATTANFPSDNDASGAVFNIGASTVTYTATDNGGNTATCSFTITLEQSGPVSSDLTVVASQATTTCKEQTFIDVSVQNFTKIGGLQFSLDWPEANLQFDSIGNLNQTLQISSSNFSFLYTTQGNLSFGWSTDDIVNGTTLPNSTILFRVYLKSVAAGNASSDVKFADFPTARKAINTVPETLKTVFTDGKITSEDKAKPVIVCPQNQSAPVQTGTTTATFSNLAPASVTDNCDPNPTVSYARSGATSGSGAGNANGTYNAGTTVVTYTATDAGGNTATCSFNVKVDAGAIASFYLDTLIANCDATTAAINLRVKNFADLAGANFVIKWDTSVLQYVNFNNVATGTGINNSSFPGAGSTTPGGTLQFLHVSNSGQWPDIANNGILFTLNFNVKKKAGSNLSFQTPLNALDGNFNLVPVVFLGGYFEAAGDNTPPVLTCPQNITVNADNGVCTANVSVPQPTATDACGVVETITSDKIDNVFQAGPTVVKYTATDKAGNKSTCSLTVTVSANTAISFNNCPAAPIAVSAGDDCQSVAVWPAITANNPCGATNFTYESSHQSGVTKFGIGATPVTVKATEPNSGASIECKFEVRVLDATPPVLVCPKDTTIKTAPTGCSVTFNAPVPSVKDNCDNSVSLKSSYAGTSFNAGITVVEYTATDDANNVSSCAFTVFVQDQGKPIIKCPDSIVVDAAALACGAVINWPTPLAADNCDQQLTVQSAPYESGEEFPIGVTLITYTAIDDSGNKDECSFKVHVKENTPPVITKCPANVLQALPEAECDITVSWAEPTATDNCGIDTLVASVKSGSKFPTGTTTVTYIAYDNAGNTDTCSFDVKVIDKVAPVLTDCPKDITVNNTGNCGAVVDWKLPTLTDNCDKEPKLTASHLPTDLFNAGITTVEIIGEDASGNKANCSFKVTINGVQNPAFINIPANQKINGCEGVASWTPPTVVGFCKTATITSNFKPGDKFPAGTTVVEYKATDESGASVTATFTISVNETEAPKIVCASGVLVNGAGIAVSDPGKIIDTLRNTTACNNVTLKWKLPSATDNCGIPTLTQTGGPTNGGVFAIGTHTITYQAKDASGNTASCSFVVEVEALAAIRPEVSPNPACEGTEQVTLTAPSFPGATYNWTGPQTGYPNANKITIVNFSKGNAGKYSVTAIINGCPTPIGEVEVTLAAAPDAVDDNIRVGTDETIEIKVLENDKIGNLSDVTITQKSPQDGVTYKGDGVFEFDAGAVRGNVSFIYEICSNACDKCDMATVNIAINDNACVEVPNTFTPNGDGSNDYFEIPCLDSGRYPNATMVIYNQWGDKVYEANPYSNDPNRAWNGRLFGGGGQRMPDGVYYYIFKPSPDQEAIKGFIQLFR